MTQIRFASACVATLLVVVLAGCQAPKADLDELMKPPPRPVELDQLEMLVGTWEGAGEMKVAGADEVMTSHGVETTAWEGDKWLLVSRFDYSLGEQGKAIGVGIWTWDPKAKKYRLWAFDNYGYCETGTATYDEDSRTWRLKTKSRNPGTGESYVGEGTLTMPDDDTQEWEFTYWDDWKLNKCFEMAGTSRRK
jgi:hypothetical protein